MKSKYILLIGIILILSSSAIATYFNDVHCEYSDGIMAYICSDENIFYVDYPEPSQEMIDYYSSINKFIPEPDINPVTFTITGGGTETYSGN